MSDNVVELNNFTAAQYWEAQADMWRANYSDAHKEIEKLRAALKPFAEAADDLVDGETGSLWEHHASIDITVGDLRAAAAALKETGDE